MLSAFACGLEGDPPDLAVGISGDLHLLFGELVGVLNLNIMISIIILLVQSGKYEFF
jgi:hypothetical protein